MCFVIFVPVLYRSIIIFHLLIMMIRAFLLSCIFRGVVNLVPLSISFLLLSGFDGICIESSWARNFSIFCYQVILGYSVLPQPLSIELSCNILQLFCILHCIMGFSIIVCCYSKQNCLLLLILTGIASFCLQEGHAHLLNVRL